MLTPNSFLRARETEEKKLKLPGNEHGVVERTKIIKVKRFEQMFKKQ